MRQKAARICLIVAIVWFLLGGFTFGNGPEWFFVSAGFAAAAAFLGIRLVRITGIVLVAASIWLAVDAYQARVILKSRVRKIQQKAAERKSSSGLVS